MIEDQRHAAVEHVSGLLERDLLALEAYRPIVDRILLTTSEEELAAILGELPSAVPVAPSVVDDEDVLVLHCRGGVVKELPLRLPPLTEIRCESGVLKVDLTAAELADADVELDLHVDAGVVSVIVPRDLAVRVLEHDNRGGVFKNRARAGGALPGVPTLFVRVHTIGGVIKLRHPRRWRRRRW